MNNPVVDADAREQALNPTYSYIVQAPAGSGKTELLMQRYLVLLARVELPEEIIAITFTRKATAEMRSRILGTLQWATESTEPALSHELKSWQLARKVLERDQEYHWRLQQNPNRLRILTIDSLSASLARQMPIMSRAGVNPTTVEDASELYRQAAQATLESLLSSTPGTSQAVAHDMSCLLGHLDNDWQKLESMLSHLLRKRDHWLRHLPPAADSDGLQQEREKLEDGLRTIIQSTLQEIPRRVPESLLDEWRSLATIAAENLRQEGANSPLVACVGLQQIPNTSADSLHLWQAMTDLLLTKEDNWLKSITKKIGFPAPSSSKDPEQKSLLKENKQRMLVLIEQLSGVSGLHKQLIAIRTLPAAAYTDDQWLILKSLFNVLKLAVAQLQVVFREKGQVDFNGVNLAALDALIQVQGGDTESAAQIPTELALSLDYKIKHLLVDEFQDTSVSQYLLIKQLAAGWEPEDGRSLFLVGDPMQSIYRFREAEVGLFLNVQQSGFLGHVPVRPMQLQVNFRSDYRVIEWINTVFKSAMPDQASVTSGAVTYSPSVAPSLQSEKIAKVQVHPLIEPQEQAEAELVCNLAEEGLDRQESVAILVRSKTHLLKITGEMQQRGLQYQAVDIETLTQRSVIRDLRALTRALLHPADRTAWLSVLRAPWCGLTLDDLEVLVGHSPLTVLDLIRGERILALSANGQLRLRPVQKILNDAITQRRRLSLARWVEGVWLNLGGPACVDSDSDLDNARNYFDLLNKLDEGSELLSFTVLDQSLARLFAAPQIFNKTENVIQLMTIHKAKGLEFDRVIIPGLEHQPRNDDRQLLQWTEWRKTQEEQVGKSVLDKQGELLLAPIEETGSERTSINYYLSSLEKERSKHETTRLLYVAATRARRHLHLIGSTGRNTKGELKAPDPRSLLARIWTNVTTEFLSRAEQQGNQRLWQTDMPAFIPSIRRLPTGWQLPTFPASIIVPGKTEFVDPDLERVQELDHEIEYLWAGTPAKHVGMVVHQLLQQIAEEGLQPWDNSKLEISTSRIEKLLKESGVIDSLVPKATQRVQDSLRKMLADDRGRWILSDKHQDAKNEYALTGLLNGTVVRVILDRTFIDQEGVRWIIDYKTGSHEGGDLQGFLDSEQERYRKQLESYAQLLCRMEDRPIKLALYFPLLSGWRSWSPFKTS